VLSLSVDIDTLTEKELIELNRRIVERLKFIESMRAHIEMMEFDVGEKVSFEPPGRAKQIGVLMKYNKKTVTVITEEGQLWNVSPYLLSKVNNEKSESDNTKVIEIKDRR